jgi:hypothetical protein
MYRYEHDLINTALSSMMEKSAKVLSTLGRKIRLGVKKPTSVRSIAAGRIAGATRGRAAALPKTKIRMKGIRPKGIPRVRKPKIPKVKMPKRWWLRRPRTKTGLRV